MTGGLTDDPKLFDTDANGVPRLKTLNTDMLSLMAPHIAGLSGITRVEQEPYGTFTEFQFWSADTLMSTLRLYKTDGKLRVEIVTATSIINTEAGGNLLQENGGKLLTE